MSVKLVRKRDGRLVPFDGQRITQAIFKAMQAAGEGDEKSAEKISEAVTKEINRKFPSEASPHIEQIQDIAEEQLILKDYAKTAKAYILYRQQRAELREKRREVPERVKQLVEESKKYFRNQLLYIQ